MSKKENGIKRSMVGQVAYNEILDLWEMASDSLRFSLHYPLYQSLYPLYQSLLETTEVLPVGFSGSRYGHDGIRLEGSLSYIKLILALLTPLFMIHKNGHAKLESYMMQIDPSEIVGQTNEAGNFVMYIRFTEQSYPTISIPKEK